MGNLVASLLAGIVGKVVDHKKIIGWGIAMAFTAASLWLGTDVREAVCSAPVLKVEYPQK